MSRLTYAIGVLLPYLSYGLFVGKNPTEDQLRTYFATVAVLGIFLVGIGQLIGVSTHNAKSVRGKRAAGSGSLVGLFGWAIGLFASVILTLDGTNAPFWLVSVLAVVMLFPPVIVVTISVVISSMQVSKAQAPARCVPRKP